MVYGIWDLDEISIKKSIHQPPFTINYLSKCKNIRKQHDSAEIQHSNYSCQGCLLSYMSNVKVFHLMEFKVLLIKHGRTLSTEYGKILCFK
jgi:hypothetical protein